MSGFCFLINSFIFVILFEISSPILTEIIFICCCNIYAFPFSSSSSSSSSSSITVFSVCTLSIFLFLFVITGLLKKKSFSFSITLFIYVFIIYFIGQNHFINIWGMGKLKIIFNIVFNSRLVQRDTLVQ